jgi:Fur family ferric uptake transcriptional regulator
MARAKNIIHPDAEAMLRAAGHKVTAPRLAVLSALLASEDTLTHREVESTVRIAGKRADRVTVYRVLEWLVEHRLAHKVAGEDRAWRFNANPRARGDHAHFHCHRCGRVFCLDDVLKTARPRLPRGFHSDHIELTVQGTCARCLNAT